MVLRWAGDREFCLANGWPAALTRADIKEWLVPFVGTPSSGSLFRFALELKAFLSVTDMAELTVECCRCGTRSGAAVTPRRACRSRERSSTRGQLGNIECVFQRDPFHLWAGVESTWRTTLLGERCVRYRCD